ncbi:AraC family transcriptional regulator [Proteinivorax tanatarense]|uniref:AraC family transcriptional regulator n=1 Tax=Proteinivorax tanatarense TaxID=1260629 RepID=A0AAU7VML1_9FIRM
MAKQFFDLESASYMFEKELLDYINKGDTTKAVEIFNEFAMRFTGLTKNRLRGFKNNLIGLTSLISYQLIEQGVPAHCAKNKNQTYIQMIEDADSEKETIKIGVKFIIDYIHIVISQKQNKEYSSHIKKAVDFMHCHLEDELSLDKVSQYVNLNRSYFSSQFKKEMGVTFNQYLISLKIEKSKFYLVHSDKYIIDIAVKLGFNSQSYFCAIFKKNTGLSPKQFRNSHY